MKKLNLAYPERSDIAFEIIHFPDGHRHFKMLSGLLWEPPHEVEILSRFTSMDDLFVIMQAVRVLRGINKGIRITLNIPYLFAARCDRAFSRYEAMDLQIVASLLNKMKLYEIKCIDPHSPVAQKRIKNLEPHDIHFYNWVKSFGLVREGVTFVAPDIGARFRTFLIRRFFMNSLSLDAVGFISATKVRETSTGKITEMNVFWPDFHGQDIFIFDDIIDGGRTFTMLADILRERNVGILYLVAPHGIFSHGYDELLARFNAIFTTNSVKELPAHERIHCFDVYT